MSPAALAASRRCDEKTQKGLPMMATKIFYQNSAATKEAGEIGCFGGR